MVCPNAVTFEAVSNLFGHREVCLMPLTFNVVLESNRSADSLRRTFEY
jgi:hypothetical protein